MGNWFRNRQNPNKQSSANYIWKSSALGIQPCPSSQNPAERLCLRHGYVAASVPGQDDPDPVSVPKLKTIAPSVRQKKTSPARPKSKPESVSSTRSKGASPETANPFRALFGPIPVDIETLQEALARQEQTNNQPQLDSLGDDLQRNLFPISAFLISIVAHLTLFLILAMTVFALKQPVPKISLEAAFETATLPEDPIDANTQVVEIVLPNETQSPIEMTFEEASTDDQLALTDSSQVIPNVVTEDISPAPSLLENSEIPVGTLPAGGGLEGRELSARARLAASQGGSKASEIAVERGLKWILAHQRDDGSWHFFHDDGQCNGQCQNQGKQESTTAATGLALMSFLGAGYTHRTGPYQDAVQKGLDYLRRKMRVSRNGGSLIQGEPGMYSHAIATIALSEAFILTQDTDLVGPIIQARKYIETAQHSKGGWRYLPGSKGDMTVTGWQLMALKSCELAGVETGEMVWSQAEDFINSLGSSSGRYGYQKPDEKNPTTTAVGILSKMYLGASRESLDLGTEFIIDTGPSETDLYFDYYATQILHHRRGDDWPKWNEKMHDHLVRTQDDSNTHRAGSWYFADPHGQVGGRLYTTAMAVMTLEVYYRFMPLYDQQAIH